MSEERPRRIPVWKNLQRGIKLAWESSPSAFLGTAGVLVLNALIPPAVVWLGKHLIDLIVAGIQGTATFADMVPTVTGLGVLSGMQRALQTYSNNQQQLFGWKVEHHATRRFLRQAAQVDMGHFDDASWHDRMARARRDVSWRPFNLTYATMGLSGNIVSVLGMLGILATLHPLLVVLSALSVVPSIAIQRRINRKLYDWHWSNTPDDREKEYMATLLADSGTAKEIRAFGLAPHFIERHERIDLSQYGTFFKLLRRANMSGLLTGLIGGAALAAAYGFVGARGLTGEFTAGDLAAVMGAFSAVTATTSLIAGSLLQLEQHATFLDDYFSFLKIEQLIPVTEPAVALPERLGRIELAGVQFAYPLRDTNALDGIDLHVDPGELIALVGENGAGKSTIVNLLLRFYDPSEGSVRVGGIDLRDTDPADIRSRFGVLVQDFAKFQLSLRDNVQLGRVDRPADDTEIMDALQTARAEFLLKTMPSGLDSKAGRLFDGGHELSGGEWQRLALARLIFRQADVWILDEPTSNLDPEAEAAIFSELKEQLHGRMGIVISHRFSTVRVADRIYVIGDGRVVESGSHGDLIARGGRYAELFELQAAGYR
jgi:ATP-binding cassette, subfamily B, bacterial